MANKYNQGAVVSGKTHFTNAPMPVLEFSKMTSAPSCLTTFNGGDIVPIYCGEVLPHDTFSIDVDFVIRQVTMQAPTMGELMIDIHAFFVPNRVVNESWKNVQGENSSGAWIAPEVQLAPLVDGAGAKEYYQVPVGSVADYYGFPTQQPIPKAILQQCHDLKFRGYLSCFNEFYRSQDYDPPVAYSKLNVYNGFFENVNTQINLGSGVVPSGGSGTTTLYDYQDGDGTYGAGALKKAIYGDGIGDNSGELIGYVGGRRTRWSALSTPLKANKLHDYFTSVLPTPLKGRDVLFGVSDTAPVNFDTGGIDIYSAPLQVAFDTTVQGGLTGLGTSQSLGGSPYGTVRGTNELVSSVTTGFPNVVGTNLVATADLSEATGISLEQLRESAAIQQIFENLGRGGSRYREFISSFFGLDVDNPFSDIPTCLGHIRRKLDIYQTAQTSASTGTSAQGSLAAFGYTATGGHLFTKTFVEHGYVHIFAVVRHKNVYSSFLAKDNFRRGMLDFYLPQLANLGEQPVYTYEINPFAPDSDGIFGYNEAWAEYRMEPDRVSGYMRSGIANSLNVWNYADEFDSGLEIANDDWLKSNTQDVVARTTASTDRNLPQFKGQFVFKIIKERPMPTYSVPGLDII